MIRLCSGWVAGRKGCGNPVKESVATTLIPGNHSTDNITAVIRIDKTSADHFAVVIEMSESSLLSPLGQWLMLVLSLFLF